MLSRMTTLVFSLRAHLVLSVLVVLVGCAEPTVSADAETQLAIEHVREVLGLEYPYRVEHWGTYRDGGTLGVTIKDRRGRRLAFSLDGRTGRHDMAALMDSDLDTLRIPHRHFYIGAEHPNKEGARELPIGSDEEFALLDLLDVISLDHFSRATRDSLIEPRLDKSRQAEVGQVFAHLKEEERIALGAGSLAASRRSLDPQGMVIHIRSRE